MSLSACQAVELRPGQVDESAVARGRETAERLGCGACHVLPGVAWPQGRTGSDLHGFADRAMIAGRVPNRPEYLTRFVRDAPALAPGIAMPAIRMTDADAQALTAWLQSLHAP